MLDDLTAWGVKAPDDAPQLLVVSRGTPAANQAMGLRAPVVLETDFAVSHAFGVTGTPSAVLVDEQGRIASPLARGVPAVLALVRDVQRHAEPVAAAG
jgi:hypothetical protein